MFGLDLSFINWDIISKFVVNGFWFSVQLTIVATVGGIFGGYPDADAAVCTGADRYGLDLRVTTPRGMAYTRVGYPARLDEVGEMRGATVDLVTHARSLG